MEPVEQSSSGSHATHIVKRIASLPTAAIASTVALLLLGQCQRQQEAAPAQTTPAVADGGARAAAATPPTSPAPADGEADAASPPPASKGTWLEGTIYRFRLDDVRNCPPPPPSLPGGKRIGAVVRVASKVDEVFVAPRDFKLQSGGVILDSAMIDKAPPGCGPLLAPKSLRAGKTADGVVVFDVPPEFNPEGRPVKITYQPTRWGGARRTEALLPGY
jgi:hypothetical protein